MYRNARSPDAMPVLFRFNYDAVPSLKSLNLLLYAVTFTSNHVPLTLTFDLEHLQCIACDVTKLCTKFERNRVSK